MVFFIPKFQIKQKCKIYMNIQAEGNKHDGNAFQRKKAIRHICWKEMCTEALKCKLILKQTAFIDNSSYSLQKLFNKKFN